MDQENTYLANTLHAVGLHARYDKAAKQVLSDKGVLARILQQATDEFRGMDLDTIRGCIEGEPQVATEPVAPGAIHGDATEDAVPGEGHITYDIRFSAVTPGKERIKLLLNIEAQNDFSPGYDLVTRGVFYAARMLSHQLETEFKIPDYDSIKKVYSIWICTSPTVQASNSITAYHITRKDIFQHMPKDFRYDLLSVVLICLGKEAETGGNRLNEMLTTLLSAELSFQQKCTRLNQEFDFNLATTGKEALSTMCNLSQGVEALGLQKGLAQGMERGITNVQAVLAELRQLLHAEGREAELLDAATSREKLQALCAEFGLKDPYTI